MPELPELRISSDFINKNSRHRFIKAFHVEKGNNPKPFEWEHKFNVKADSNGKELLLNFYNRVGDELKIWVFTSFVFFYGLTSQTNWNSSRQNIPFIIAMGLVGIVNLETYSNHRAKSLVK